jgi:hypothetical protein
MKVLKGKDSRYLSTHVKDICRSIFRPLRVCLINNEILRFKFQIKFPIVHNITAIEVQGRFGGSRRREFAEFFFIKYTNRSVNGWKRYRNESGNEVSLS